MFDNYSATEELAAFLLGDITSAFLGSTGMTGLLQIILPDMQCRAALSA